MLRVLFIILAVVSLSLAIVLGEAMLYALAAVLLIAAVGLMTAKMRRRHNDVPETFMQATGTMMMTTTHQIIQIKLFWNLFSRMPPKIRSTNPQQERLEKKRLVRELWFRKPRRNLTLMC